jgi:hypothetical protein
MVRGLQNMDEGLKEKKEVELKNGIEGSAHAWVNIWHALFYNTYATETVTHRGATILNALERIFPREAIAKSDGITTTSKTISGDQNNPV